MLGPAEPDALGTELACLRSVLRGVRVRAYTQAPKIVGPIENRPEVLVDRRRNERTAPTMTRPVPPSTVITSPARSVVLADAHRPGGDVDREILAPRHTRLAHPASDNGSMRGHAAASRQDASCTDEAVDVVRRRLQADEDHGFAFSATLLGSVRVEHDRARRCAR